MRTGRAAGLALSVSARAAGFASVTVACEPTGRGSRLWTGSPRSAAERVRHPAVAGSAAAAGQAAERSEVDAVNRSAGADVAQLGRPRQVEREPLRDRDGLIVRIDPEIPEEDCQRLRAELQARSCSRRCRENASWLFGDAYCAFCGSQLYATSTTRYRGNAARVVPLLPVQPAAASQLIPRYGSTDAARAPGGSVTEHGRNRRWQV